MSFLLRRILGQKISLLFDRGAGTVTLGDAP